MSGGGVLACAGSIWRKRKHAKRRKLPGGAAVSYRPLACGS